MTRENGAAMPSLCPEGKLGVAPGAGAGFITLDGGGSRDRDRESQAFYIGLHGGGDGGFVGCPAMVAMQHMNLPLPAGQQIKQDFQ